MNSMTFKLNTFHLVMRQNLFSKMLTNTLNMDTLHEQFLKGDKKGDNFSSLH